MQDIVLIGTILIFLTIIYTLPIAALYNVPNNQRNRILCILVPQITILIFLLMLLLQIYFIMEHDKSTGVYIALVVIILQIGLVFGSLLNYWGLSSREVIKKAMQDANTSLKPSVDLLLNAGLIHLISLF